MWIELILKYQLYHHKSLILIEEAKDTLFFNPSIKRRLDEAGIRFVLEVMVKDGLGIWQDETKSSCVLSWKKFSDWSVLLVEWARSSFQTGKILTLYELAHGDLGKGTEFQGVDTLVLLHAVKVLERQGKAVVIAAENADETGVKIL
jgi:ESCRT-II complex subunit VPS25